MAVIGSNHLEANNSYFLNLLMGEFRNVILPVTIFLSVEACFGLVCNLITLCVFITNYRKCTYRCFVIFLATIDSTSCVIAMSGEILAEMFWFDFRFPAICRVKSYFDVFTVCADVLCLLAIALDRYKQTCMPYVMQISQCVAVYICVGIVMASAVIAAPAAWLGTENKYPYIYYGTTVKVTVCGHRSTTYVIFLMLATALSLPVMILLHVLTTRHFLCRNATIANRDPDDFPEQQTPLLINRQDNQDAGVLVKRLRRQSIMMFIAALIYVGTIVCYLTVDFLLDKTVRQMTLHKMAVFSLLLRLPFINNVINPIVYGFLDPHFQITCSRQTNNGRALN